MDDCAIDGSYVRALKGDARRAFAKAVCGGFSARWASPVSSHADNAPHPWPPAARTVSRPRWTGHDLRTLPKSLRYKVPLGRNGSTASRDRGPARGEPSGEKTQDPRVGTSTVFSAEVSPRRGLRSMPVVSQRATALVGGIGRDGDALALADADDAVGAGRGGQVVCSARPARVGDTAAGRPDR
jgi:hypothetical protein